MEKETKKEKKSNSGILVTLLVILLLIAAAFGGYLVGASQVVREIESKRAEAKTIAEASNVKLTDDVQKKLNRFVNAGSVFTNSGGNITVNHFIKGVTSIPKDIKLKMTYNSLYIDHKVSVSSVISQDEINTITGVKPENETVDIMYIDDFADNYEEMFNETAKYEFKDLKGIGCPTPMGISEEYGRYYLFSRCGGTGVTSYETSIDSTEYDKDHYLVHETLKKKNAATGETETTKLVWKFDKDLNFISTEKE